MDDCAWTPSYANVANGAGFHNLPQGMPDFTMGAALGGVPWGFGEADAAAPGNTGHEQAMQTPSPLLHSALPPFVVPPFECYDMGGEAFVCYDMGAGLPPAFEVVGDPGMGLEYMEGPGAYMAGVPVPQDAYVPGNGFGECEFNDCGLNDGSGMLAPVVATGPVGDQPVNEPCEGEVAEDVAPVLSREASGAEGREYERHRDGRRGGKGRGREQPPEADGGPAESPATAQAVAHPEYTAVMLRNIPNKYTRDMLVKRLNEDHRGAYDFMYLPIDFKNRCNVGYSFINFRTAEACQEFVQQFHGVEVQKCLPGFNSKKVVEVTPARVQGLAENVRRLANSPVMNQLIEHPEWMPLVFDSNGDEAPFPSPDRPLAPVRPRARDREARGARRAMRAV